MALKASMRILLVDETPNNRQVLKRMLSVMGFKNIKECADGERAWQLIQESSQETSQERPFELIISDWEVPKIAGIELLKKVRSDQAVNKVKFLMLTNEAAQQNVVTAVKAGANNIMVRPFSANMLTEKLGKIFGQK